MPYWRRNTKARDVLQSLYPMQWGISCVFATLSELCWRKKEAHLKCLPRERKVVTWRHHFLPAWVDLFLSTSPETHRMSVLSSPGPLKQFKGETPCHQSMGKQCEFCYPNVLPRRKAWQPTPVFLSGKSHGQRSLVGYSPWGHKRVGHKLATKQCSLGLP